MQAFYGLRMPPRPAQLPRAASTTAAPTSSTVRAGAFALAAVTAGVAAASMFSDSDDTTDPSPFPGLRAHFVLDDGDWTSQRRMHFTSMQDSLLTEFTLREKDKHLYLYVGFSRNNYQLKDYFERRGIVLNSTEIEQGYYRTKTDQELRTLFKMIVKNNDLAPVHLQVIKNIIGG